MGRRSCLLALPRPADFLAPEEQAPAIIRGLPIGALRLPNDIVEGLLTLGFERVGEVEAAPRASLTLRFGPELGRRLDQAMGRRSEPFEPARSPELIEVRRALGEPIGAAETIARYTGILVATLCEALEAKGLGARRLDLLFHRVDYCHSWRAQLRHQRSLLKGRLWAVSRRSACGVEYHETRMAAFSCATTKGGH